MTRETPEMLIEAILREVRELRAENARLRADSQQLNVLTLQWNTVTKAAREEIERLTAEKISLLNWLNSHHPHVAIAWARALEPKP